ncbi:MAG: hypothetical protein AB1485_06280 [Candidatus Thermoplasmatota archaeon]
MGAIEKEMAACVATVLGGCGETIIELQKKKLRIPENCSIDDYITLANELKVVCTSVAGAAIAKKAHQNLLKIIKKYQER